MTPDFLDLEDVLELHARQLSRYGGGTGLRDRRLLESAVSQAQSSFGGEFMHRSLEEMAAAYLFHIVSNHPFVDGNKRTGLLSAMVFLELNGVRVEASSERLYELTYGIAAGHLGKDDVVAFFDRTARYLGP